MHSLEGLHVLILGLGASGLAMARWCARHGAVLTVADTREAPPQLATLQAEWPQATFIAGPFTEALVTGTPIRAVFRSPGLAPEAVAPVVNAARAMGLWQGGELSLFAAGLNDLQTRFGYAPQVLAITGTNGKTTATSLTGQLVARAKPSGWRATLAPPCWTRWRRPWPRPSAMPRCWNKRNARRKRRNRRNKRRKPQWHRLHRRRWIPRPMRCRTRPMSRPARVT